MKNRDRSHFSHFSRIFPLLGITALLIVIAPTHSSAEFAEGEILVKFAGGIPSMRIEELNTRLGCAISKKIPGVNIFRLEIPPSSTVAEMVSLYRGQEDVLYAEPNYLYRALSITPNDPYYEMQWHLPKMRVNEVWRNNRGSDDVIIAVVDTGIDLDHADLDGQLMGGYDFMNNDDLPDDDNGHGTMMAGVIAAETNNGEGVSGILWDARLMPVKVLDANGFGSLDLIAQGIVYAADNGASVINLSLGSSENAQAMIDAVDYAYGKGCVLVAGTGNDNSEVMSPACLEKVIAVGATDEGDNWCGESIWGVGAGSNYGDAIDVVAPGNNIISTWAGDYYYVTGSGTSLSTACVSGLAGLLISANPRLTNSLVAGIILSSADDLMDAGWDRYTGFGRINAEAALELVRGKPTIIRFPGRWPFLLRRKPGWFIVGQ